MEKKEQLYEGKAKKVYATEDPNLVIVSYKDDATAFDGAKKGTIVGKGVINNQMTNRLMAKMEKAGIPTHFVEELSERDTLVKKVSIVPGDVVVLSSTPIPGNEKAVANVINELSAKGAKVICQDTHVSGHACQEDLKLIYSLVHPKFAIPVHGEFRHRMAQKELAEYMGVQKGNALLVNSGDVVSLDEDSCQVTDHVACGAILVDGLGVGDVGNIVLRDRQNLAQNGIIVVVLTLEKHSNQLLSGPDIVSRGFVYVRESEDLLEEAHNVVADAVADCLDRHVSDWGKIKNIIKDSLSDFLWKRMKRNPMILPIIMEV